MIFLRLFFVIFFCLVCAECNTRDAWNGKSVYQLLTDRLDKTKTTTDPCNDLADYCGGTFVGAKNRLKYIAGLGVDAIWISPFVANTPKGYHGYWAKDLYSVNEHFGDADELKELINEAHSMNLLVMVDVVVNHMGQGMEQLPLLSPFNDTKYYHDCGCLDGDCCPPSCWVEDYHNEAQMLHCQLFGLPDLNHDMPEVANELKNWIRSMVREYKFDGIRLDTVPYVKLDYWKEFDAAAGVFSIGEVSTQDLTEMEKYVTSGAMDSTLQYPLYYAITGAFGRRESFAGVSTALAQAQGVFDRSVLDTLGVFSENHDNPRFLTIRNDLQANRGIVLFTLCAQGIPIVYYGQEQGYHGGTGYDDNREPLWTSGFPTDSSWGDMYSFIRTVLIFRRSSRFYKHNPTEIFADESFYAFSRGDTLFAMTNVGESGPVIRKQLTGFGVPWEKGTTVCNLFFPEEDCIEITTDFTIDVVLMRGESKVYFPK